jgi:hypothetical protein
MPTSDGQTLQNAQDELLGKLSKLLDALEKTENEKCELACDLAMLKRRGVAELRDNRTPVAIIGKLVDGHPRVARLELKYEKAKAKCDVFYERINAVKKEIDVLDGRIQREWGRK